MKRSFPVLLMVMYFLLPLPAGAQTNSLSLNQRSSGQDLFVLTYEDFQSLEAVHLFLDPVEIDSQLVAVAVFHETNRVRTEQRLAPLKHLKQADAAAELQSQVMMRYKFVGHANPYSPELRTLMDRIRHVELTPRFIAENVAMTFGMDYDSGRLFYVRMQDGRRLFSYDPQGEPIPMHTYGTFAESLVEQWMNSPEHRRNILSTYPEYLGVSCLPSSSESGMLVLYSTQVFFTPMNPIE